MKKDALLPLLSAAGWGQERLSELDVSGPLDPILPTPFRLTEAGVAGLAAVGLAASDLWELRTGRRQKLSLDPRQVTASMRSPLYLTISTKEKPQKSPAMGVFPSKNGRWNYIHANFDHHRAAALKVLGVPEDRDAVIKAVSQWDGLELEEALFAAGGVGGMVRTMDEWAAHPQSAAVASLPLIEFIKIGEAPPEPLPAGKRPLSGIRVLDLTRVVAGPVGTRSLAEHGADVMRVTSKHLPHLGSQDYETGHGKLSASIDLRDPAEAETLRGLVKQADVFVQGYRPGTIASKGFSPEDLVKMRPGLVTVSFCAFSHLGPWSGRRGFDTLVQSVSGISWRQGQAVPGVTPGPRFYPVSAVDFLAGYVIAYGVMVALRLRATEGGSWMVRTSLAQVAKWLVDLGQVSGVDFKSIPEEFTAEELKRWMTDTESPIGMLHHFTPVLRMSETPPAWVRPAVPLGYHPPAWPARGS